MLGLYAQKRFGKSKINEKGQGVHDGGDKGQQVVVGQLQEMFIN